MSILISVIDDTQVVLVPSGASSEAGPVEDDVSMQVYKAAAGSFRGRSVLTKNALSLVMHGRKTMHFAARTVYAGSDEVHLLSSGNCVASMELGTHGTFESILIYFDTRVHTMFLAKYDGLIHVARETAVCAPEPYLSFPKDKFITSYISTLHAILGGSTKLSADMKRLKLEEIMLHLLEAHPGKFLSFSPEGGGDLSDLAVRHAVEASIARDLSIEELAFLCKCSPSTFKRRFRNLYGTSPIRWIRRRRMELAADLLRRGDTRPSEVYYQVGFESHSSFSQAFKSTFGVTPQDYKLGKLTLQQQSLDRAR
ncbi:MAG TPA: AraC family transcriptional regulator [Spirochaetia bacterium]|nr:AraC family transcriptional regulator [Spirochaetia bacterium]